MKMNVQTLNECLGIDGPIWIEDNPDNYVETHKSAAPVCARMKRTKEWKENIGKANKGHSAWNKGGTIPEHQKEINRQMMKKRYENGLDVSGANNPRAKTWRIVYADGREVIVGGLQRWAVDNGYSTSGIKKIAYGHWKTYRDLVTVEEVAHRLSQGAQETL